MAILTMSDLVAALTSGQKLDFYKASATAEGAGTFHSLWKLAGLPPAGANPGSLAGVVPTNATVGALSFVNPTGGPLSYLGQAVVSGATVGKLIIYDRLWHNSTMSGTQTVADTTLGSVPDLTRYTDGLGVEPWVEVYTAIGATAATLNIRYTNQDGTTLRQGTYAHPANAESVGQMARILLAAGDTGVRKCTAYHWSVTTGTAGDFGLVLLRRLAEIPLHLVNVGVLLDFAALGLPKVEDHACLAMMVLCSATNTGILQGSVRLVQG